MKVYLEATTLELRYRKAWSNCIYTHL